MITYSFESDIFYVTLKGKINLDELISYLKEFSRIENLPDDILLIYDLQDAGLKFLTEEVEELSKHAEMATRKYKSVKTAFLVNEPMLTAYTVLFSQVQTESKTKRNLFSTKDAAIKWLKS